MENNRGCIKTKTRCLMDPTKIDAQKAASEQAMLPPEANGSHHKKQLCKDTLDVRMWAKGKVSERPRNRQP